jgi:protein O-mannosyl-transferase
MLDSIGRRELAEDVGREALTHLPYEAGLHFNLANTLGKLKQFSQAERHFLKATQLDTQNAKYHANLGKIESFKLNGSKSLCATVFSGVLYHRWKKFAHAEKSYLTALDLDPNLQTAKDNLQMLRKNVAKRKQQN